MGNISETDNNCDYTYHREILPIKQNVWVKYEAEKQKIIAKATTPEEYSRMIKELVKRLGI